MFKRSGFQKAIATTLSVASLTALSILPLAKPAEALGKPIRLGAPFTICIDRSDPNCVYLLRRANLFIPDKDCKVSYSREYPTVKVVRVWGVPFCAVLASDAKTTPES